MRVAAAACLVSSGLLVGGASTAIAFAAPDTASDPSDGGSAGPAADQPSRSPGRDALSRPGAGATPITGRVGARQAEKPRPRAGDPKNEPTDSKLPDEAEENTTADSEDGAGEQSPDPTGTVENPRVDPEGDTKGEDDTKEDDEDECGWWWPSPPEGDIPSSGTGDGYDGVSPPVGRPSIPPGIGLPHAMVPESPVVPVAPDPLEPPPGLAAPAALPMPVLTMPMVALPPAAPGGGSGGAAGAAPRVPAAAEPRPAPRSTPPAERPAAVRGTDAVPANYRAGYGERLRTASTSQVIAMAVPGATGIMLLTGAGGLIGYRQARAGLAIRAAGSGRFVS